MFNLGLSEIVLISIIALIFIGPKQLPEIARALGRALNELKKASEDLSSTIINPKNFTNHEKNEELSSQYTHSFHHTNESDPSSPDHHHESSVPEETTEETLKIPEIENQAKADPSPTEDSTTSESKKADT